MNVLISDDSAVMRKMIARSLRQTGLEVAVSGEAGNGVEGLSFLADNTIDLVLCDWNMPEMNGLDFVKELRKSNKTPVVMLTTESAREKIVEAMEAGADGYLTKPFTPESLAEKLSLILGL